MLRLKVCAVVLACSAAVHAETVTSSDSRSWNGTIMQMQNGILSLQAKFPGGKTTTLQFGPSTLRSIEFNPNTYNPGAPPTINPGSGGVLSGTVYLRDKTGNKCSGIGYDAQKQTVTCSSGGSWPKQNVLRIIFTH